MSGFSGRRGVNVSQFIANLNTIPSAHEMATQNQEGFNIDEDLALFTNTEFFDFDMGEIPDITSQSLDYDPAQEERARRQHASAYRQSSSKPTDFINGDFQFPDFTGFPNVVTDPSTANLPPTTTYPLPNFSSPTSASPASVHSQTVSGNKRKLEAISDPNSAVAIEEGSRLAAEEDKRRRNTAASARFRIKKKQREQALEKTAKEMTEKVTVLEARVAQLEMENKWLKSLITEKNDSKVDIAELYKKFTEEKSDTRSNGERTDGVGTNAAEGSQSPAKA